MAYFLYGVIVWLGLTISAKAEELKIVVNSASDGHGIHARLFAHYIKKYEKNTVIIKTVPGAAGAAMLNYLYNIAPKDGSEIAAVNSRAIIQAVFNFDPSKNNLTKLNWLGSSMDGRQEPFVLWAKAGSNSLIAGTEGGSSVNHIRVVNNILRWNVKEVVGYPDSVQTKLAFERGEINLVAYNLTGIRTTNPSWLSNTSILPMVQYGSGQKRHNDLPFVPTLMELSSSDEDRKVVASLERLFVLGRAFAAPPETSVERLHKLRALFDLIVNDLEYRHDAEKIGVIVSPIYWREAQELVEDMYKTSPDAMSKLNQF